MSGNYVCVPSNYRFNNDWIVNLKNKLYMYNHITDTMIEDMLTYLTPGDIASGLLSHNKERYLNVYEKLFIADPSCMIKFPEDVRELYRCRLSGLSTLPVDTKKEEVITEIKDEIPDVLFETFEQLSLFDFMNAS